MAPPMMHSDSLETSTALAGYYVKNFISPLDVIRVLHEAGVKFMLVGAHGLGGWIGAPRATKDVEVLVGARGSDPPAQTVSADEHELHACLAQNPNHVQGGDEVLHVVPREGC